MGEEVHPTPAHHLQVLLARAQNPFDVSDSVLSRLESAVMFQTELYGWRHRSTPPPTLRCSSFRHVFLLADGGSLLLWELCYDTEDGDGRELYEIYESEEALRRSERRVHRWMDDETFAQLGDDELLDGFTDEDFEDEPPAAFPLGPGCAPGHAERDSPEHARRLLRRAENPDRPGEETLRLLATALGHQIMHVPKPAARTGECQVWCSVYEHVFLLADGTEISLYELEHNLSGTGRLVCEVYLEEAGADEAALQRARDRGIDL
ncbi:DUF6227 family protein [Streptomyces sp. NPDC048172]|uniref:DUF6227 family protein n=1 Tax=Streptomyces sp. NPDC048172 TaxID=3365505 RepID=UPI0037238BF5